MELNSLAHKLMNPMSCEENGGTMEEHWHPTFLTDFVPLLVPQLMHQTKLQHLMDKIVASSASNDADSIVVLGLGLGLGHSSIAIWNK